MIIYRVCQSYLLDVLSGFYSFYSSVLIASSLFVTQMKQGSATSGTNNNNSFANNIINDNNNADCEEQLQPPQQLSKLTHIVNEWDDGIIFDVDDPDFCPGPSNVAVDRLTTATNSCVAALRNLSLIGK